MEIDSNQETQQQAEPNDTIIHSTNISNHEKPNTKTNERFQTELIMAEMDVLEKEISLKTSQVDELKKQVSNSVKKEKDFKTAANQSFTKAHSLYKKAVIINKNLREKIKNLEKSLNFIESEKREILSSLEAAEKEGLLLQGKFNEADKTYKIKTNELNLQIKKLNEDINEKNEQINKYEKKNKNITESNNELTKANNTLKHDLKELTNLTTEILNGKREI